MKKRDIGEPFSLINQKHPITHTLHCNAESIKASRESYLFNTVCLLKIFITVIGFSRVSFCIRGWPLAKCVKLLSVWVVSKTEPSSERETQKCFRYSTSSAFIWCIHVLLLQNDTEKTQRMTFVFLIGLVSKMVFYLHFFMLNIYEFSKEKCIFLAAIINEIQAMRKFTTRCKPWRRCTYCRSVKSTYSPAYYLHIDFWGNKSVFPQHMTAVCQNEQIVLVVVILRN